MSLRSVRSVSLLLATAATLSACGDDDPVMPPGDGLNDDEAAALASLLVEQSVDAGFSSLEARTTGPAEVGAPAGVPIEFETEFGFVAPCPLGGSVDVQVTASGTVDDQTRAADLSLGVAQVHEACTVADDESGLEFTLDGDPDLSVTFDLVTDGEAGYDVEGIFEGAVAWSISDARSGRCELDLAFEAQGDADAGTGTASLLGRICGIQLSRSVSVG